MTADILNSVASLLWPLLLIWAIWRLGPVFREVIRERDVHAKGPGGVELSVGGQPVSTQQAVDDQRRKLEAVRSELSLLAIQVVALTSRVDGTTDVPLGLPAGDDLPTTAEALAAVQAAAPLVNRLLWVDDQPATNSYELAALRDRGIHVIEAASTQAALTVLDEDSAIDAVVSDMHRQESGEAHPEAGIELLQAMRREAFAIPVVVYTSQRSVARFGAEARKLGAVGATATASELFELLGVNFGPGLAQRVRAEVQHMLTSTGLVDLQEDESSGIDFIGRREDRRVGIEVKAWRGPTDPRAIEVGIRRLANLVQRDVIDEAWLVSPEPLGYPTDSEDLPDYVRLFSVDELRQMQAQ